MKTKKAYPEPPKAAKWILNKLIDESTRYTAMGDFEEQFMSNVEGKDLFIARVLYWLQIIVVLPAFITYKIFWSTIMFKHYLKIALRNIKKHKGYSFINIAGLTIGMACCIVIMSYILYELSYEKFHENSDRVYRLGLKANLSGRVLILPYSNSPTAPALCKNYPEVVNAAALKDL